MTHPTGAIQSLTPPPSLTAKTRRSHLPSIGHTPYRHPPWPPRRMRQIRKPRSPSGSMPRRDLDRDSVLTAAPGVRTASANQGEHGCSRTQPWPGLGSGSARYASPAPSTTGRGAVEGSLRRRGRWIARAGGTGSCPAPGWLVVRAAGRIRFPPVRRAGCRRPRRWSDRPHRLRVAALPVRIRDCLSTRPRPWRAIRRPGRNAARHRYRGLPSPRRYSMAWRFVVVNLPLTVRSALIRIAKRELRPSTQCGECTRWPRPRFAGPDWTMGPQPSTGPVAGRRNTLGRSR